MTATSRTPRPHFNSLNQRGSALVLVMVLIFALSILVLSMNHGLSTTINSNNRVASEAEMVQTAIGFVNIVRASMSDGELPEEMEIYRMDAGRERFAIHADWDDTRSAPIYHTFRLEEEEDDPTLGEDEARITVRAERQRGSIRQALDVSVIILTDRSLPHNAYYGNTVTVGTGLTTHTPLGAIGDIQGLDEDDLVFHEGDVFVTGEYENWEWAQGSGQVHEDARVPGLEFDTERMVEQKSEEWAAGGFNQIYPGAEIEDPYTGETIRVPDDGDRAVWLKFDENYPNHVTLATTESARQSVANPYTDNENKVRWPLTFTEDGEAMIHVTEFRDTAVEGTYSHDITIVADEGTLQVVNDLQGASDDIAPIGLISSGHGNRTGSEAEHEGNVYVRGMRNSQDYGFAKDSDGVVHAHIYAAGVATHFHPTGTMETLEFNAKIMAMGEGDFEDDNWRTRNTDFHNVARNRHFWDPINDLYPPGMDPEHVNVINMPPQLKSGTWSIGRVRFEGVD